MGGKRAASLLRNGHADPVRDLEAACCGRFEGLGALSADIPAQTFWRRPKLGRAADGLETRPASDALDFCLRAHGAFPMLTQVACGAARCI